VKNEKFCPICKNKNERTAIVCIHCGASLDSYQPGSAATTRKAEEEDGISANILEAPIDKSLIPEDGIAVYAAGTSKPVYLRFEKELVFGRKSNDTTDGTLLDLTDMGGYRMGISRQHAMIRRAENGYEIIDLASTNGSWLNNVRLVPNKPYPLASGSQLRFARMQLLILYHSVNKKKRPE
jgi:hypothetical protein